MNKYSLERIFTDLNLGDLSQIHIGDSRADEEEENLEKVLDFKAKQRIVSFINFGLIALYTRFPLKEREVLVKMISGKREYVLDREYAVSNEESAEPDKHILDNELNPFKNDIIRIDSCFGSSGTEYAINNDGSKLSIYTPDYITIQVPNFILESNLSLIYRAKHDDVVYNRDTDEKNTFVHVPSYLYDALLQYVTYRVHKMRNNQEARVDSLQALQLFNALCEETETRNLTHNGFTSNFSKLDDNGWV